MLTNMIFTSVRTGKYQTPDRQKLEAYLLPNLERLKASAGAEHATFISLLKETPLFRNRFVEGNVRNVESDKLKQEKNENAVENQVNRVLNTGDRFVCLISDLASLWRSLTCLTRQTGFVVL